MAGVIGFGISIGTDIGNRVVFHPIPIRIRANFGRQRCCGYQFAGSATSMVFVSVVIVIV
jgi:hypothetical protein